MAAAADLWRERPFDEVSVSEIAHRAGVSTQTIYNLIGGLDALAFAVIERLLDRLDSAMRGSADAPGIDQALDGVRTSAALFTADAQLYRQLMVRAPKAVFEGARLDRDSAQIQMRAVMRAQQEGALDPQVDATAVGRSIYIAYMGALYAWASGGLTDAQFEAAAELAAVTALAAHATPAAKPALTRRLRQLLTPGSL